MDVFGKLRQGLTVPRALVTVALLAAVAALLATSPTDYDFASSDAPRHAMNGAFVLDALKALPWRDPMGFAVAYYLRFPSLSIGFYPPLFYVAEAAVFAVLGVSHVAAQATVALFTALLAAAAYRLARLTLPRGPALAAALLLLGAPDMAQIERQVLLDIPVQALLLLGLLGFARYVNRPRPGDLWLATLALTAGLYVKFSICFIAVPLLVALWAAQGRRGVFSPRVGIAAGVAAVLAVPALWLTLKFGMVNLDNVAGRAAGDPLASLSRWTFYLAALPQQLGWATLALAVPGAAVLWRRQRRQAVLAGAWAGFGYVFFSAIRIHEPRHDLMILFPATLCAAHAIAALPRPRLAASAAVALAAGTLVWSLAMPVPRLTGYAALADRAAALAPPNSVVLLSAFRDSNFVFAMRARGHRPDIAILRANKWLLRFAVDRHWGITQAGYDRPGLVAALHDHGVGLAVAQRGFWTDLQQMAQLDAVLHDPALYRTAATVAITGALDPDDRDAADRMCHAPTDAGCTTHPVDIVLPLTPPALNRAPIEFDLPFLGRRLRERAQP